MTVEDIIDAILVREGGFVDHPADRGGPTKHGITQGTLAAWRGHHVSRSDVEALTVAEARAIYMSRYITQPGFHRVAADVVRAVLVDDAVLSGPEAAIKTLQKALLVPADGKLGPVTLAAVNSADPYALVTAISKARCLRFGRLVQQNPDQRVFLVGWLSRALEFIG